MEIERKTTGSTAGNVNADYIVPPNEVRKILYGQVILTTDATVANRRVIIQILDSSNNVIIDAHSGAVVAASASNQHHEFMQGIFRETSFTGNALQVPIGAESYMSAGWKMRVTVENGQAGDAYTAEFVYERVQ